MKRNFLYILGLVFLAIGIIGFFNDPVFGVFDVNTEHNILHIVTGLLSLYFAGREARVKHAFGVIMMAVYGLITVMGFLNPNTELFGVMAVNDADNILHIIFTAAFAYVGLVPERVHKEKIKV